MSLTLELGTKPSGLSVKSYGIGKEVVFFGEYEISMEDFLIAAHYVLTNANLRDTDPRLQFVECVRSMQVVEGYPSFVCGKKEKTTRLSNSVPPVLLPKVRAKKQHRRR